MRAETYSFAGDICNGGQIILKWIISESVTEMWIGRNCFRVEQSAGLHYHIIRQLDPVLKDHIGLLQSVCLGNLSNTLHKAVTAQFEGARCVSFRFVTLRYVTLRYATPFGLQQSNSFGKAKLAVSNGATVAGIETTNWRKYNS